MKINGKKIAKAILLQLKEDIAHLNFSPGLAVILAGNNVASKTYVKLKENSANEIGIQFYKYFFDENVSQSEILKKIHLLNYRADIHGILVQLPLPKHIHTQEIIKAINPNKDVDGFHPETLKRLGTPDERIKPVIAEAVLKILKNTGENLNKKSMLIIGNSPIFLDPLKKIFSPICKNVKTTKKNIPQTLSKEADIIIIAIGKPYTLKPENIKKDSILIDIGINFLAGKTVGDVDPACYEVASFYTPVPGGVGPVTVAKLLENTYKLACYVKKN